MNATNLVLVEVSEFHIQKNKDWNFHISWRMLKNTRVWIPYPEKQGLKLISTGSTWLDLASEFHIQKNKDWNIHPFPLLDNCLIVWIPYPEKQGLKQLVITQIPPPTKGLNSISRKTRIETKPPAPMNKYTTRSEFHIQKNKDWNFFQPHMQTSK